MPLYNKTCKNPFCKKSFTSEARNTKYCGPECQEASRKRNNALQSRRRKYQKNSVELRGQAMSRKAARMHAFNELVTTRCHICGQVFPLKDIEVAHKDQNCYNNVPENYGLFCVKCHSGFDSEVRKRVTAFEDERKRLPNDRELMEMSHAVFVDAQVATVYANISEACTHNLAEVPDAKD